MVLAVLLSALMLATGPARDEPHDAAIAPVAHYTGPHAPLRLRDPRSRRFRSALADAYEGDINFAGRYVLAEIGCGANCIDVAALDVRTGAVRWFPFSVSNWSRAYPDPLEYQIGSSKLIVHGELNEEEGKEPHRFVFNGRAFLPK